MRRHPIVYLATALLVFLTIKLAYIASQIENDPRYLLNNWVIVGISAAFVLAFYYKPFILRWLVAPYFLFSGVVSFMRLTQSAFDIFTILNALIVMIHIYAGIKLFTLRREKEERIQTPTKTNMQSN